MTDVSRALRRVPVVRDALEKSDPARRARRLAASGIVDAELYGAQYELPGLSVEEAARHYATVGFFDGATVNALVEPDILDENLMISGRPIIYDYINSRAWNVPTSAWWDGPAYVEANPDAARHPAGPVGHLWNLLREGDSSTLMIDGRPATLDDWHALRTLIADASHEWATFAADGRDRRPDERLNHPPTLPERFPEDRERPLVSVILPVRNRAAALRRAVESLQAQTWTDWELLIVDDGSWDDTLAILDVLESRDTRVRVIRRGHAGVCAARNAGIADARGQFVAFLDSDNTWMPRYLEDMMTWLTRTGASAGHATIRNRSEDGISYRQRPTDHRLLLHGNTIDLNTFVVRRDLLGEIGGFDPSLRRAVDFDLILRVAHRTEIEHVPTVGADYDNTEGADDRISTTEPLGWNVLVRLRHLESDRFAPTLGSGVTYLVVLQRGDPQFETKLAYASELAHDDDSQVIIALTDPRSAEWRRARVAGWRRGVEFLPRLFGREPLSFVVDACLRDIVFDRTVIVGPATSFAADDLRRLGESVTPGLHRAAMPLVTSADGTLEGVGAARRRPLAAPFRMLAGHPVEDARHLPAAHAVPSLTGRVFALPTADLRDVGGLDPLLYNAVEAEGLSAHLLAAHHDYEFIVRTDIEMRADLEAPEGTRIDEAGNAKVIAGLWEDLPVAGAEPTYAGLAQRIVGIVPPTQDAPVGEALRPLVVRDRESRTADGRIVPCLRWAIKTASPSGPVGETWGDTHFARSLADALRSLGQEAVIDSRDAVHRRTEHLDDVVIALRGLDVYKPTPGALSFLWVISHPDLVTQKEASAFDAVFAASTHWARVTSERWGLSIDPLLQCTDPERFHPTSARRGNDIVFVGNSRGIPRPTVMESVRAGLDVKIYGGDWEPFLPPEVIKAEGVDNAALAPLYGSAALVLNDHWADMQREGFMSNRLFDVVAAGGRVLSDRVTGIDEVFGGAVHTYDSVSEIVPLLSSDPAQLFPEESELAAISERIRREHSFEARARVLLDRALSELGLSASA